MRKDIELWWKQARRDAAVAKSLFRSRYYDYSSFWCQQAAEKALKALLRKRGFALIKTHDLVLLARKLGAPERIAQECRELTPVYVETRYPATDASGFRRYTKRETETDICTMGVIIAWVKENL